MAVSILPEAPEREIPTEITDPRNGVTAEGTV